MSTNQTNAMFEMFWINVQQDLDVPVESKEIMFNAWKKLNWSTLTATSSVASTSVSTKKRGGTQKGRLTNYNLFMMEKTAELTKQNVEKADRSKRIAEMWNALPIEQKKEYAVRAKQMSSTSSAPSTSSSSTPSSSPKTSEKRKPNGYNLFMKHRMEELKTTGVAPGNRLKQIGAEWSALSESEQSGWKEQAKALASASVSAPTSAPAPTPTPSSAPTPTSAPVSAPANVVVPKSTK